MRDVALKLKKIMIQDHQLPGRACNRSWLIFVGSTSAGDAQLRVASYTRRTARATLPLRFNPRLTTRLLQRSREGAGGCRRGRGHVGESGRRISPRIAVGDFEGSPNTSVARSRSSLRGGCRSGCAVEFARIGGRGFGPIRSISDLARRLPLGNTNMATVIDSVRVRHCLRPRGTIPVRSSISATEPVDRCDRRRNPFRRLGGCLAGRSDLGSQRRDRAFDKR